MPVLLVFLCFLIAFVCFVLAAIDSPRVKLGWAQLIAVGLAVWVLVNLWVTTERLS